MSYKKKYKKYSLVERIHYNAKKRSETKDDKNMLS